MNNQWKMVPVEPTREMCMAARQAKSEHLVADEADSPVVAYRAMLAAAPVPPAGDVEVLGCAIKDYPYSLRHSRSELDKLTIPFGDDQIVELVDRAKVTRLTAERDGLLAEVERLAPFDTELERVLQENATLQSELTKALEDLRLEKVASAAIRQQAEDFKALSWERGQELTKARELLLHMQTYSNKYPTSPIAEYTKQIAEVLAHQTAPAAKGGSDE